MKRLALLLLAAGCSGAAKTEVHEESAIEHGRALFSDTRTSASGSNRFTCATCHPGAGPADRIYPGAPLAGVTSRSSFWGGNRLDLLESVNDCRLAFMDAVTPWTPDDPDARAMYAYLASLPGAPAAVPFTVVHAAPDLPAGDPAHGKIAFDLACTPCHGNVHDGKNRIASYMPSLPDEFDAQHATLALADRRLIVLRQIREGGSLQIGGNMPPFSKESLSDEDVSGILAYLARY